MIPELIVEDQGVFQKPPLFRTVSIVAAAAVLIGVLLAVAMMPVERVAAGSGTVRSGGTERPIVSVVRGSVVQIRVKEGDAVRTGQVLLVLDDPESRRALADKEEMRELGASELKHIESQIESLAAAQHVEEELKALNVKAMELEPAIKLEQARRELELSRLRAQRERAESEARLHAGRRAQRELVSQIEKLRAGLEKLTIVAPEDGRILRLAVRQIGETVAADATVAVLAIGGEGLRVEAFVPNADAGTLQTGQAVRVKVDAFPYPVYEAAEGTVEEVSADSDVRDGERCYRVSVRLHQDHVRGRSGETLPLRVGLSAQVEIRLGRSSGLNRLAAMLSGK